MPIPSSKCERPLAIYDFSCVGIDVVPANEYLGPLVPFLGSKARAVSNSIVAGVGIDIVPVRWCPHEPFTPILGSGTERCSVI